jgi:hypothetical protein
MALSTPHPQYVQRIVDWNTMRDCHEGERVIKEKGETYLPPTAAMLIDNMSVNKLGWKNYQAYKMRAVFHDYVKEAVKSYMGLLHQKPAVIELPDAMKPLLDNCTINGEDMQMLLRKINEQQLITGRVGLLLDMPAEPDQSNPMPYIASYYAETINNWDDSSDEMGMNKLNLVVLNETAFERDQDFVWRTMEKYRVLILTNPSAPANGTGDNVQPPQQTPEAEAAAEAGETVYQTGVFYTRDGQTMNPDLLRTPLFRGKALNEIPFVFINTMDVVATPDSPPLLGLAEICLTMYRGEADYRQSLHMNGQDTLVVIGGLIDNPGADEQVRVGAGARLDINLNGDAKYIGTNSAGIPEQRMAVENDHSRAIKKSMILASSTSRNGGGEQRASGDALRVRMAAQTATLTTIATAGGAALERILRICAEWMGQDPTKVIVKPNLEFADFEIDGKEFVDLETARTLGAPISQQSIHGLMVERGLTKMTYEDETSLIQEEDAGRAKTMKGFGLDLTGQQVPPPPPPPSLTGAAPKPGNAPASA